MDLHKEWDICSCVKSFEIFNDICSDALADTLINYLYAGHVHPDMTKHLMCTLTLLTRLCYTYYWHTPNIAFDKYPYQIDAFTQGNSSQDDNMFQSKTF